MKARTLTRLTKHLQGKHPQKAHGRGGGGGAAGGGKVVALSGDAKDFTISALNDEARNLRDDGDDTEAKAVGKIQTNLDKGKPLSKSQRSQAHSIVRQQAKFAEEDDEIAAFDKALAALS